MSGLSRAFSTNGATAFTSWVSSNSTVGTSARHEPPRVAVAQVDLLQVLVEPASREQLATRRLLARQQGTLRERRRRRQRATLGAVSFREGADECAHLGRHPVERVGLELHHVLVERGRSPDGLARVVDHEVETGTSGGDVVAERLDARRVAEVEAEHLEPVTPVVEVGLPCVPQRGVAREAGGHDQLGAGTEELDPGLIPDLHPTTGEQRDPSAQVGGLRRASRS